MRYLAIPLFCAVFAGCGTGSSSGPSGPTSGCGNTTVPLSQQVANPISYLSSNNNGLMLQFPYLSSTYGSNVTGYAVLGVATTSNNTPATAPNIPGGTTFNTLQADPNINDSGYSMFTTQWGSGTDNGFIDSGSTTMVFPNAVTPSIPFDNNSADQTYLFYTPASSTAYTATNVGYGGSPSVATTFDIENIDTSFNTIYNVYSQWGIVDNLGTLTGDFDWGLPFFLGRTVFVGLEGTSSSLGSGFYWSYMSNLNTAALTAPTGSNVMPVTIGGYGNEPMVSVTVCVHGTSTCATIPNILLDTGSSGLRVFASALPAGFASKLPSSSLGECVAYADNSIQWGSVAAADVTMGGQTASNVPIHVINTSFGDGGAACYSGYAQLYLQQGLVNVTCPSSTTVADSNTPGNPDYGCPYFDSSGTTYNGILGVNFMSQDCGSECVSNLTYLYYSCQ